MGKARCLLAAGEDGVGETSVMTSGGIGEPHFHATHCLFNDVGTEDRAG